MNVNVNYEEPSFQKEDYERIIDQVCKKQLSSMALAQTPKLVSYSAITTIFTN